MRKEITPSRISSAYETNATDEQVMTNPAVKSDGGLTNISGKFKNQKPMNSIIKKLKK